MTVIRFRITVFVSRDDTTRTCDPLVPNQVYYQLYYIPIAWFLRPLPGKAVQRYGILGKRPNVRQKKYNNIP